MIPLCDRMRPRNVVGSTRPVDLWPEAAPVGTVPYMPLVVRNIPLGLDEPGTWDGMQIQ